MHLPAAVPRICLASAHAACEEMIDERASGRCLDGMILGAAFACNTVGRLESRETPHLIFSEGLPGPAHAACVNEQAF